MKTLLHILLAVSYLTVCFSVVSLNKKQGIINSIVLLFLSLSVLSAVTQRSKTQVVLNLLWELWYLLFNGASLFAYRSSNGKMNLHGNKFLLWGLFIPINSIFAITCYFFH